MAKRPLGLGKSHKKRKVEPNSAEGLGTLGDSAGGSEDVQAESSKSRNTTENKETETETEAESDKATIQLAIDVDPDDELGQLEGLYTTYQIHKKTAVSDDDFERSRLMLNGIIHECDRLLRNTNSQLPLRFHYVYGTSLLDHADLVRGDREPEEEEEDEEGEEEDESLGFIEAAVDRLMVLEEPEQQVDASDRMDHLFALLKARAILFQERRDSKRHEIHKQYEKNEQFVLDNSKTLTPDHLSLFSVMYSDPDGTIEDLDWVRGRYEKILKVTNDPAVKRKAIKGIGEYHIHKLQLEDEGDGDEDEDDDDDEDDENIKLSNEPKRDILEEAKKHLLEAETLCDEFYTQSLSSKTLKPIASRELGEVLVLLAETIINLGNLYPAEGKTQLALYADAVKRLRRAQALGHGSYQEIINDLEGV